MKLCVFKAPGSPAELRHIDGSLAELQTMIGGYIELVPVHGVSVYCNEDGIGLQLKPNVELTVVGFVYGPVVVLGEVDADGNDTSLTEALAETWREVLDAGAAVR